MKSPAGPIPQARLSAYLAPWVSSNAASCAYVAVQTGLCSSQVTGTHGHESRDGFNQGDQ